MSLLGTKAPLFQADAVVKGVNGYDIVHDFSLEQFLGKKEVVFFFYPKDFTFVCPTEIWHFQDRLQDFEKLNVAVVGCSTDTAETHAAWLEKPREKGGIMGVSYPLVADVSKVIASNYGVLGGEWSYDDLNQLTFVGTPLAYRGTFLIDKTGIVRYAGIHDMPLGRSIEEILRIVDMWQYVSEHGEVCPANWVRGDKAMKPSAEGLASYFSSET